MQIKSRKLISIEERTHLGTYQEIFILNGKEYTALVIMSYLWDINHKTGLADPSILEI